IQDFFTGTTLYDTIIGTITGAVSVGQPFLSYIIGGELSTQGISLYAITAFILSFVTLGVVQLPLEYSLFGMRFTLLRNLLSFIFSILVSLSTVYTLELLI
ncbi:MAG: permease, partial [Sulfurimonas sp.]